MNPNFFLHRLLHTKVGRGAWGGAGRGGAGWKAIGIQMNSRRVRNKKGSGLKTLALVLKRRRKTRSAVTTTEAPKV